METKARIKAVITSDGCEQLAVHNLAPALGIPFYDVMSWDRLWGTPLEPELGINPECLIIKGFFVPDFSGEARMRKMMGDAICKAEFINRHNKDNCRCTKAEKVVILWAGSDVIQMAQWRSFFHKYEVSLFKELRTDRFIHIPVSEKQRQELDLMLDIKATKPLPTPSRKLFDPMPMPGKFTVAVYMPTYRADTFRFKTVVELAETMPDAHFIFFHWMFPVGDGELTQFPNLENAEFIYNCSREQYEDIIKRSCCLLRIPTHEGLSGTSGDFLMAGRPVVSCHDMPEWAAMLDNKKLSKGEKNAEFIASKIRKMSMDIPEETRRWYLDNLDPTKYKARFNERIITTWPGFQL